MRRDHSIWPSDRSKTRSDGRQSSDGMRSVAGASDGRGCVDCHRHFTRYWKTACRLSSGDVTSSIAPSSPDAASSVSRA